MRSFPVKGRWMHAWEGEAWQDSSGRVFADVERTKQIIWGRVSSGQFHRVQERGMGIF